MGYKVSVTCDKCGAGWYWDDGTTTGVGVAKQIARKRGWSIGIKGWICAECSKQKKHRLGDTP
jgi:hypothetical protein